MEAVCEEAMRKENDGLVSIHNPVPTVDIIKPNMPVMSHSNSEDISSDDGLSQVSEMRGADRDFDPLTPCHLREKPPHIGISSASVTSGSMDADDSDMYGKLLSRLQYITYVRSELGKAFLYGHENQFIACKKFN